LLIALETCISLPLFRLEEIFTNKEHNNIRPSKVRAFCWCMWPIVPENARVEVLEE
jgi:hypothetical protein